MEKKRILICEDEEQLCNIYKVFFSSNNFEVMCAENGEEGLKKYPKFKPDIILLDMRMPKLDGQATLKKLRELDKDIPVIVITAYGYICQVIQMMNLGISGYITKPVNYDRLLEKIYEIFETTDK